MRFKIFLLKKKLDSAYFFNFRVKKQKIFKKVALLPLFRFIFFKKVKLNNVSKKKKMKKDKIKNLSLFYHFFFLFSSFLSFKKSFDNFNRRRKRFQFIFNRRMPVELTTRWVGGLLTNKRGLFSFLKQSRMEKQGLLHYLMGPKPDVFVCIGVDRSDFVALEGKNARRPVVVVADTHVDLLDFDYPIFGNENTYVGLFFCLSVCLDAYYRGWLFDFLFFYRSRFKKLLVRNSFREIAKVEESIKVKNFFERLKFSREFFVFSRYYLKVFRKMKSLFQKNFFRRIFLKKKLLWLETKTLRLRVSEGKVEEDFITFNKPVVSLKKQFYEEIFSGKKFRFKTKGCPSFKFFAKESNSYFLSKLHRVFSRKYLSHLFVLALCCSFLFLKDLDSLKQNVIFTKKVRIFFSKKQFLGLRRGFLDVYNLDLEGIVGAAEHLPLNFLSMFLRQKKFLPFENSFLCSFFDKYESNLRQGMFRFYSIPLKFSKKGQFLEKRAYFSNYLGREKTNNSFFFNIILKKKLKKKRVKQLKKKRKSLLSLNRFIFFNSKKYKFLGIKKIKRGRRRRKTKKRKLKII